jgi:hypothetical protein
MKKRGERGKEGERGKRRCLLINEEGRGEREEREESGPVTLQNTKKYEPYIYLIVYTPVSRFYQSKPDFF